MKRPRLYGEPFGGMWAVGLSVVGGLPLVPVYTYKGIKTGYRRPILRNARLEPGISADALFYGEADHRLVRLHQTLVGGGAGAVAEHMRGWLGTSPKQLFDDLQEGPEPNDPIAWASRHLWLAGNSWHGEGLDWADQMHGGGSCRIKLSTLIKRVEVMGKVAWPPVMFYHGSAAELRWKGWDLTGCVFLLDPPYRGVTGYKYGCSREDVLRLAWELHRAGAMVIICEAVPLDGELGAGWHHIEVMVEREGQVLRGTTLRHEFLTMNVEPIQKLAQNDALEPSLAQRVA